MKNNRPQHKRIYYVPGILTLTIAPILFMFKTDKYISDRTEHCISIIVTAKNESEEFKNHFLPRRNYQVFKLSEQVNQDSLGLILIENFARGLSLSKNEKIGLKVIFDSNIKYKTYIDLMNTCLKSGINNWIPYGDTIFIFHKNFSKDCNNNICQNYLMPDIYWDFCGTSSINSKPKITLLQKIKNEEFKIKLGIPFAILYLILIYLTIRKIKNEG